MGDQLDDDHACDGLDHEQTDKDRPPSVWRLVGRENFAQQITSDALSPSNSIG